MGLALFNSREDETRRDRDGFLPLHDNDADRTALNRGGRAS